MTIAYGTLVNGILRPYIKYEISNSDNTDIYAINVQEVGVDFPSTSSYKSISASRPSTLSVRFNDTEVPLTYGTFTLTKGNRSNLLDAELPFSVTKTADAQTLAISLSVVVAPSTVKNSSNAESLMSGFTLTQSLSLSVPPLIKPTVAITGSRNNTTPSTVDFSATVNSFVGDRISSIVITDGNGNVLARKTTTTTIGESGQITQSFTVQGLTTGSIVAKVTAIGRGGASAEASTIIPVAFFTMDVQAGGKEIAFGSSAIDTEANASEHGKFNCFMDAKFHNGFSCDKPLFKTSVVEHTIPTISAHSYASNVSLTPPTISGYKPIAIAGFGSGSFRIYASYLRLTEDGKVSLTLANSTATNFTQGSSVFRVAILYALEEIAE